jgi:hypothetical protein
MSIRAFLAAVLVCASLHAQPRFVGLAVAGRGSLFAMTEGEGGPTRWVALGEEIDGYTLVSFEPEEQALVVEKGHALGALLLSDSKTGEMPPDLQKLADLAIGEVRGREGWGEGVRAKPPERFGDGTVYRVMVHENADVHSPLRMVIVSKFGQVRGYFKVWSE